MDDERTDMDSEPTAPPVEPTAPPEVAREEVVAPDQSPGDAEPEFREGTLGEQGPWVTEPNTTDDE